MSRIDELEAQLDALTTAVLPPMRATKYVDRDAFAQLNQVVRDLVSELGDSADIARRLAGKLRFVFTQALTEAEHCDSSEAILEVAWSYEDQLEKLFGPWFSSAEPTPGLPRF